MVCVSVKRGYQTDRLKLDLINMNSGSSWFHSDELEDMDGAGKFCQMFLILSLMSVLKLCCGFIRIIMVLLFHSYCDSQTRKCEGCSSHTAGQRCYSCVL